jgi:hypothetical protein
VSFVPPGAYNHEVRVRGMDELDVRSGSLCHEAEDSQVHQPRTSRGPLLSSSKPVAWQFERQVWLYKALRSASLVISTSSRIYVHVLKRSNKACGPQARRRNGQIYAPTKYLAQKTLKNLDEDIKISIGASGLSLPTQVESHIPIIEVSQPAPA